MEKKREFKISKYRNNGARIFTGRDNGIKAREDFGLNRVEEEEGEIYIVIPTDTWGINPSFFGGLFEGSIKKLGDEFSEKYRFLYPNGSELEESLKRDIEDNISYVIRNISVEEGKG
ncbi:MAG: hypothetical protein IJ833_01945 [Lachnospiraceae bacterium]|nr:hypothetical protein [Lachnospiraceae bacterium]